MTNLPHHRAIGQADIPSRQCLDQSTTGKPEHGPGFSNGCHQFVSFLLKGAFAITSGLSLDTGAQVHAQDMWNHRMSTNGFGVTSIRAYGQGATVNSFVMDVSFSNLQITFTSEQAH